MRLAWKLALFILWCVSLQAQTQVKASDNPNREAIVEAYCSSAPLVSLYAMRCHRATNYLVSFRRSATGVEVYRLALGDIGGGELEILSRGSSVHCAAMMAERAIKPSRMKMQGRDIEKLLNAFHGIDLKSDTCPRSKKSGRCVDFVDGGAFEVRAGDHAPVLVQDISGFKHEAVSENQPLLDWSLKVNRKAHIPTKGK